MKIEIEKLVLGSVSTNVYLIFYNGNCLIIDPSDEAERIISCIEERKAKPLAILITHGHFDHIMAAPVLAKKYGIKIYAGEADRHLDADCFLKGGDELEFEGFKLKVIYTPGHTVGSISFYSDDLQDNEAFQKAVFTGDALFAGSIGRVDFPTGNEEMMRKTLDETFKKMPPETVVFPGHGAATTIERELLHNPYLR